MLKLMVVASVLLAGLSGSAQDSKQQKPSKPSYSAVSVTASRQANPVEATPESLERGKKRYSYDCALCHGDDGAGKGEAAKAEKLKLSDFTDPATLRDKPDGELFYVIKNGRDRMPPEGDRAEANDIWDLVNYIRSLAKKPAPAETKPQ